jgi:hypothetical protein
MARDRGGSVDQPIEHLVQHRLICGPGDTVQNVRYRDPLDLAGGTYHPAGRGIVHNSRPGSQAPHSLGYFHD